MLYSKRLKLHEVLASELRVHIYIFEYIETTSKRQTCERDYIITEYSDELKTAVSTRTLSGGHVYLNCICFPLPLQQVL